MNLSPAHPALNARPICDSKNTPPILFVVVDTEEEFDWAAPFSRGNTNVSAIRRLHDLQRLLDRYKVRPTYVIDYPVATRPEAYTVIRELNESGTCDVGAHLHPWVTPPFTEEVTGANSFACNLGVATEEAKLRALTEGIEQHVGVRPRIYKAGRYGFGASTIGVLRRLDYLIDVSINPLMDYSSEHGPNFDQFDARPFWFGINRELLEVPCTHGFAGFARRIGRWLHRTTELPIMRTARMTGIMCRTGTLNKIMLSPETSSLAEMQALTRSLLVDGVRTFTVTLHSPSVEAGHTPYVRNAEELRAFFTRLESYCDYFLGSLGGRPGTLEEFRRSALPVVNNA